MKQCQFDRIESKADRNGILELHSGTQVLQISLCGESVIRLRYHGLGRFDSPAAAATGLPPLLVKEAVPLAVQWLETPRGWKLQGNGLKVKITVERDPFVLTIADGEGNILLSQSGTGAYHQQGSRVSSTWRWDGKTVVGLGEKMGPLDKRGRRWVLWNTDNVPHLPNTDPLYQSIPWLLSPHWGLFVQNSHRTEWDLGQTQPEELVLRADGGPLDQWIFLGEGPQAILTQWSEWVGKMSLPPLWALGHHQSRYSYYPQSRVIEVAQTLRERHIPCDVIHLDIDHMDGYRDFTWDPREFPDPDAMNRELHALGYHVVGIVDPGVKKDDTYDVCAAGLAEDVFCAKETGEVFVGDVWPGPALFPDFACLRVRDWWAKQQAKHLAHGLDGIWNDMNEPSVFNVPGKTFPPDVRHGEEAELTHAEIHNRYGSLMSQAACEGLQRFAPEKRPFVLTRAGFAGVQRHAAVWLGDNSSWWYHLAEAVPMCLNMGLSGVPFVGTDIGGFMEDGEKELLLRWIQLGIFTPFCRNHSNIHSRAQEPWAFDAETENIYRQALELRYRLLPTLYTLFEEASRTGDPMMRALLLEFPNDEVAWRTNDEFLLGRDCLVAPVVQKGARERLVYLPAGTWQERATGKIFVGPAHVVVAAGLSQIPILLRQGAMLALGCGGQFTRPELLAVETLEVYAQAPFEQETSFYADEGEGYAFRAGEYRRLTVKGSFDGRTLRLKAEQEGNWQPQERVKVEIHWRGSVSRQEWVLAEEFCHIEGQG
ncbi:alpha-xylosidase [Peptococcaceae bacterium CEB3]|nr:alpha-xylosidase [Peptococcaceae bacterium CEB3]